MIESLHPFFDGVSAEQAAVLSNLMMSRSVSAGEVLFRQGDLADCAYFVTSGCLGIDVRMPGGGTSRLTERTAGSVVGELALISAEHRRTAMATALEPTELHVMLRRTLLGLCAYHDPISLVFLASLTRHVAKSLVRIDDARLALGRAPRSSIPDRRTRRAGADFGVRPFLRGLAFTRALASDEIDQLLELGRLWTLDRDTVLLDRSSDDDALFLVVRGAVEVCAETEHGVLRMAQVGPGHACGGLGPLLGKPQRMTCVTRVRATVLELPPDSLRTLADPKRSISYPFREAAARSLMTRLVLNTRALAHERCAGGFQRDGLWRAPS